MARIGQIKALARVAKLKNSADPVGFLETLLQSLYDDNIADGKVLISTTENGGNATFTIPPGETPMSLAELVSETITWLESQADPANPDFGRRIKRLRVSFNKAVI